MSRLKINLLIISVYSVLMVTISIGYSALQQQLVVLGNADIEYYTGANPCTFDGTLSRGVSYTNGPYTYRFMQEGTDTSWSDIDRFGWGVVLTDRGTNSTVTSVNTPICSSINGLPIVSMANMFQSMVYQLYQWLICLLILLILYH